MLLGLPLSLLDFPLSLLDIPLSLLDIPLTKYLMSQYSTQNGAFFQSFKTFELRFEI